MIERNENGIIPTLNADEKETYNYLEELLKSEEQELKHKTYQLISAQEKSKHSIGINENKLSISNKFNEKF